MNIRSGPALTAQAIPTATPLPPSARQNLVRFLLSGCGVDVEGIETLLAEVRQAERDRVQEEIERTDREAQALAERRQALVKQLYGGATR